MKKLTFQNLFRTISLIIAISVLASLAACTGTVQGKSDVQKKTLTIGHRGYSGKYPENTIKAFKGAFKYGFDGVECDVWENKGGVLLVHHDSTITRMTGKSGYIWNLKIGQRDKFPIVNGSNIDKYKKGSLIIPTLTETLKVVSKNKGYFILHVKNENGYKMSSKGVKKIIRLLDRYKMKKKTIIIGRKSGIKNLLKSGYKIALNISPGSAEELKSEVKWCKKNGIKNLCVIKMDQMKVLGTEKKFAKYCKKHGLEFGMYTTPDNKAYKMLTRLGAKFAMSDDYVA